MQETKGGCKATYIKHALVLSLFFTATLASAYLMPIFASEPNSWTTKSPAPTTRITAAVAFNDKIHVFAENATYTYDPQTDTWSTGKPMPTPRNSFAVAASNGKIYVTGGSTGQSTGANEGYTPETDTWKTKTAMPTNRSQIAVNAVNGKIYVAGGRTTGAFSTVGITEVYDVSNDSWSTRASMLYPVTTSASAVVDDKLYVIGGQDEFTSDMNLKTVQIYDPTLDQWRLGKPAPGVVYCGSAGATTGETAPKRIYVFGAMAGFAEPLNSNFAYDPEADSWSGAAALPTARYNPCVAVVDDLIYVIGGGIGFPLGTSVNEQYTPIGYGSPSTPLPTQNPTPTPTPPPALTASLSESASALNYGETVNFTVSADGGTKPYTYTWYLDNWTVQTSDSPYYSTNNQTVGSHHVYVKVTDMGNDLATTRTVEFNVLPVPGLSPSPSATQQPTPETLDTPQPTEEPGQFGFSWVEVALAIAVFSVGSVVAYFLRRSQKHKVDSEP